VVNFNIPTSQVNPDIGLTLAQTNNSLPFIRLPRAISLKIIGDSGLNKIYSSLGACERLRKTSLIRSDKKQIFGDYGVPVRYTCAGVQVARNSKEVLDNAPYMDKLSKHHLKSLLRIMRRAERSFEEIADHQVISHLKNVKAVVPFKTMSLPSSAGKNHSVRYFGGIAFGSNAFLRCHTDADFTMSIAQVFLKGQNTLQANDDVVVYFCFPTLGAAVPLFPGDFLLFNALIPHCISSRCKQMDEVMCLSMYLKTACVGLNNNDLVLTTPQAALARKYHECMANHLQSPNRQLHLSHRYQNSIMPFRDPIMRVALVLEEYYLYSSLPLLFPCIHKWALLSTSTPLWFSDCSAL
jgi:hypothetical protein